MKSLLLLSLPLSLANGAQKPIIDWALPRGVNPALSDKFRPDAKSQFTCLSSPSHTLPYSLVNDDFCDCPDGSDEPGTAACSHLNHSVNPLPGFYCENKGHTPTYIPFSLVNDGICDYDVCCDGSDEWMGVGDIKCENRCATIGKEARKVAAEARKLYESGVRAYRSLVSKAVLLKKEVEDKIVSLDGEIVRSQGLVDDRKRELKEAEAEEKSKMGKSGGGKGKHGQLLDFTKDRTQEMKEKLQRLKDERDALYEQLEKTEKILKTFKEEYNPNFNDEGVKRAVKSWEDYLAGKSAETQDTIDFHTDLQSLLLDEINWEDWEPEETIIDDMYAIEAFMPPFLRTWVHGQLSSLQTFLVENGLLAPRKTPTATTSTSTKVQKASDALSAAESDLATKQSDLNNLKTELTQDYGANGVFRALKDACTEAQSGEYTYSFCHLGRATQKNRDGGHTHLGDWTGFERRLDDEIEQEVLVAKYEHGLRCWNGPERSAYVYLRCSAEEKVLSVAETEKCVYKYVATSPAVCEDNGADVPANGADETWGS
ncbi:hypothetical protein DRE_01034 [Drechslerella stenobrocha 248]|uniref:Glucosidase 2 subunit beta n=1 Tax=Drechslerella stenobrocha 248 TaxID=1043628 RepID=W7I7P4_9PEZI|nr:hypothetical protein DRE_01034 [Drechslerella stenobrocha 248]